MFPFKYHPRLAVLLVRQRAEVSAWERAHGQLCPTVFHWRGRSMQKLRRSWRNACNAAGLPGRLLHDFRRTAVRNLICAGVPQAVAMKVTGHKTDSSFRRYLIVDDELRSRATGVVASCLGRPRAAGAASAEGSTPRAGKGRTVGPDGRPSVDEGRM